MGQAPDSGVQSPMGCSLISSKYTPANERNGWQHSPDGDVHAEHELDVERAVAPKRVEAPRVRALGHDGAEEREGTEDGDEGDREERAQAARRRRTDVDGLRRAKDSSGNNDSILVALLVCCAPKHKVL